MSSELTPWQISRQDLMGRRFGRMVVVGKCHVPGKKWPQLRWVCRCDCGEIRRTSRDDLVSGKFVSCGCYRSEIRVKHGMARSGEYRVWIYMIQRCINPRVSGYHLYGGRGITVHPDWLASFEAFYRHVGPRPTPKHTLDRIDTDGNYEPGNVRWATLSQNHRNKRCNHRLEHDGRNLTIVEWSEITGIPDTTIHSRLRLGWTVDRALTVIPRFRRDSLARCHSRTRDVD